MMLITNLKKKKIAFSHRCSGYALEAEKKRQRDMTTKNHQNKTQRNKVISVPPPREGFIYHFADDKKTHF